MRVQTAVAIAAMMSYAASADAAPPETKPTSSRDPNAIVCEKVEVVGSRLGTKRVCKTRAEWAEMRRLDRHEIDKAQVQRGSCETC